MIKCENEKKRKSESTMLSQTTQGLRQTGELRRSGNGKRKNAVCLAAFCVGVSIVLE